MGLWLRMIWCAPAVVFSFSFSLFNSVVVFRHNFACVSGRMTGLFVFGITCC